ncbi:hypothetical protein BKA62DRAFT_711005 [Auriculariales sp. MPI-PUGE-AT-0066]|nr:hypothetical protein BKA62DRAFT_711005 [Auriculariales sp. MPI-PUGE-AT-0066]
MGGSAFTASLPDAVFPRMSPARYEALKADLHARLLTLFARVGTPREAPGKPDYGDIDFVVTDPLPVLVKQNHRHLEVLSETLGAAHALANNTDSFAIAMAPEREEDKHLEQIFVQVDVNKCGSVEKWGRVMFFHSFGDLGMILGLLARSYGLSLGEKGIKIVTAIAEEDELSSFFLSDNFDDILGFFGLDREVHDRGFPTQRAVFDWVRSSRLFHPACLHESARREHRRQDRKMYLNFLQFVRDVEDSGDYNDTAPLSRKEIVDQAKLHFGKEDEFNALVLSKKRSTHIKSIFTGKHVMEWTGVQGMIVREIMNGVRAEVSEDQMMAMSAEDMEQVVCRVHAEINIKRLAAADSETA